MQMINESDVNEGAEVSDAPVVVRQGARGAKAGKKAKAIKGDVVGKKGKATKATKAKAKVKAKKPADGEQTDLFDRDRYSYERHDTKTAGGRKSVNSGDRVALALMGKDSGEMKKLLKENGLEWNPRWDDLNEGMRKMNSANRLRAAVKRGEKIKIDGKTVASL